MISRKLGDGFWGQRIETIRTQMIPFQLHALKDELEDTAPSHAIENFEIAAGLKTGEYYGMVFQDSDVGKWIEAASYGLMLQKDDALEAEIDRIIDIIAQAQQPDGYLNTYYTVKEPGKRWTNLRDNHEMYCAGHLIEGAIAYYEATGKRKFMGVMCRMADHIYEMFGPGRTPGYPGHPELELALYRLYGVTGNGKYAELAALLINRRGESPNFFDEEHLRREGKPINPRRRVVGLEYYIADMPLRQQQRMVGHAVRAMYLMSAVTDQALLTGEQELIDTADRLWENVVRHQMYITGGYGATAHGEAFSADDELPNDTVYAETCASVAFVFWAKRMLRLHRRGQIADDMERTLYNTVLSGANLACDRYFYVNPLEVVPGVSGSAQGLRHALPDRPSWFGCACCPPNMARLLLSLHDYAYDFREGALDIHLYVDGTVACGGVRITHTSNYPWDGRLQWQLECETPLTVALRIPSWSRNNAATVDGAAADVAVRDGYWELQLDAGSHQITLNVELIPRRVYANAAIRADANCVALMRGPVVYCIEGADNPSPLCALRLPRTSALTVGQETEGVLAGMCTISAEGLRVSSADTLYSDEPPVSVPQTLKAIPYYAWDNRGVNEMRVWIEE